MNLFLDTSPWIRMATRAGMVVAPQGPRLGALLAMTLALGRPPVPSRTCTPTMSDSALLGEHE